MLKNVNCYIIVVYYYKYDDEMIISIWRSLVIFRDDIVYFYIVIYQ